MILTVKMYELDDGDGHVGSEFEDEDNSISRMSMQMVGNIYMPKANANPYLYLGLVFGHVVEYTKVLLDYAIKESFGFVVNNESDRVTMSYKAHGCPWRVHASPMAYGNIISS